MSGESAAIVFVTGLSGSGKTTAMDALEDLSFYCVDNLPGQLIGQVVSLCAKVDPPIQKIAVAIDAREPAFLREVPGVIRELRNRGAAVDVIFLECSNQVLVNRYRETRRVHPLAPEGTVEEGIEAERRLLVDVARLADSTIETTDLNVHRLKAVVSRHVSGKTRPTAVTVGSFGFRYGTPPAAELLFDVRFLPNPQFEAHLRDGTGRDVEVAAFALESPAGVELLDRLGDLLGFLLPLYDAEGKAYLRIGVGCTGGRHRSVAVSEALAQRLREAGREVNVEHRDVERP